MSKPWRNLMLAGCIAAVPLGLWAANAQAQQPSAKAITLYDVLGRPVAVLTPLPAAAADAAAPIPVVDPFGPLVPVQAISADPFLRLIAQQDAMMNRMVAQMDALASAPIMVAGPGLAGPGADGQVLVSVNGPARACSETVTFRSNGPDAKPIVHVSRQGPSGCAAILPGFGGPIPTAESGAESGAAPAQQAQPSPPPSDRIPAIDPRTHLWQADYVAPAHPAKPPLNG